ncbi:hypothetical protein [Salipaludibacillus daqingensis]|uniref:hypothetical protein n=1 Tax=Salipaludibacillus daqingensis TaxID=3041001 RepID=UPI0024757F6B|nr:hypothetical protein [Salipaludibacillus daqingensis]
MKIVYQALKKPIKVNVLAAGVGVTKLFLDAEEITSFTEAIIPVAEKSRLVENVERHGKIYDVLIFTELTNLVGYGFIEDDVAPEEAVAAIEANEVEFEHVEEELATKTRILYFEEKPADF